MIEYGFEADYAVKTACEVAAFAAMHPDWRVVDDGSWDGSVVDDDERAEMVAEGWDLGDVFKKVGSRYQIGQMRASTTNG